MAFAHFALAVPSRCTNCTPGTSSVRVTTRTIETLQSLAFPTRQPVSRVELHSALDSEQDYYARLLRNSRFLSELGTRNSELGTRCSDLGTQTSLQPINLLGNFRTDTFFS